MKRLFDMKASRGTLLNAGTLLIASALLAACSQGTPTAAKRSNTAKMSAAAPMAKPAPHHLKAPSSAPTTKKSSAPTSITTLRHSTIITSGSSSSAPSTPTGTTGGGTTNGGGGSGGGTPPVTAPPVTTPPVTTPPTTTPPAQSYVIGGENGVFEAINAVRENNGLPPLQGWANSAPALGAYPQTCALHWNGNHCATNEVETGTLQLSGQEAVNLWMGDSSHRAIILEPGAQKAYVGWAWLAPSAITGAGGYVTVVDICGSAPGNQANCP